MSGKYAVVICWSKTSEPRWQLAPGHASRLVDQQRRQSLVEGAGHGAERTYRGFGALPVPSFEIVARSMPDRWERSDRRSPCRSRSARRRGWRPGQRRDDRQRREFLTDFADHRFLFRWALGRWPVRCGPRDCNFSKPAALLAAVLSVHDVFRVHRCSHLRHFTRSDRSRSWRARPDRSTVEF